MLEARWQGHPPEAGGHPPPAASVFADADLRERAGHEGVERIAVEDLEAVDHLEERIAREAETGGLENQAVEGAAIEVDERPEGMDEVVLNAQYFDDLREKMYNIRVYETDYMTFCPPNDDRFASCFNYGGTGMRVIENLDLDMVPKALLITKIYLRLSTFYNKAHALYLRAAKKPRKKGWRLPIQWWLGGGRVTPIYSMRIIDEFQAEVENAKPGDMFLIHLFLPHYPYAYDAECNLKDPDEYLHAPAISTQYQGIKSA